MNVRQFRHIFRYFEFQATLSSLTKAIVSGENKESNLSGKGFRIIPCVGIVQEGSQVSQAKEMKATLKIDAQPTSGSECFSQEKNGKEQQHSETRLHSPSWLFFLLQSMYWISICSALAIKNCLHTC